MRKHRVLSLPSRTGAIVLESGRVREASPSVGEPIATAHLKGLRVLVVHDWLIAWGGAERCLEQILHLFPQADLVVGVLSRSTAELNSVTRRARETWLGRIPGARTHHRWFLPLQAAAFATLHTDGYDLVISSCHAFSKSVRSPANGIHISYCYSPPRYLWELYGTYRTAARGIQRAALIAGAPILRHADQWFARRVDYFIAISQYVAARIHRSYGRVAPVVYPPVIPKGHTGTTHRKGFLLSLGRLVAYKRVDLAIRAAESLGIPLVVGGDGPERRRLQALGGRWTTFVGEVSDEEAGRLLSECMLFVFSAEEDFGIAPVEANAHGAPVVAYGVGGIEETMIQGVTAELYREPTVPALADAIRRAMNRSWDEAALKRNAARFSAPRFRQELGELVQRAVEGRWL